MGALHDAGSSQDFRDTPLVEGGELDQVARTKVHKAGAEAVDLRRRWTSQTTKASSAPINKKGKSKIGIIQPWPPTDVTLPPMLASGPRWSVPPTTVTSPETLAAESRRTFPATLVT